MDSRSESIWRVSVTYIVDALIDSLWRKLGRNSKGWKKVTKNYLIINQFINFLVN